ncbi:hypothetical protein [Thiocapsa sp.]|uniref:hypothetical protein n=1 Tax=Thiocapsa sp. TaxID=2024551 RepID=UPI003593DBC6
MRHAAQVTVRDHLDQVPLGVGVERLLDVRLIEEGEQGAQVMPGLVGQRQDVAVAGTIQCEAQVGPETLDACQVAEGAVVDIL